MNLPRRLRTLSAPCLAFVACALASSVASATDYLAAEPMAKVRVDGLLRDWPGGFAKLAGGGGEALVGYDAQFLYLAAKLEDPTIVRTSAAGKAEDRLTLDLWVPSASGSGGQTVTISVYPGDPGKLAGLVKVNGQTVPAAKAVEAPGDGEYVLEAQLPWSAIPAASSMRVGLRGKLSYFDSRSAGKVSKVSSTSPKSGGAMPPLTLESETGLFQTLLEPRGLSSEPARVAYADLTGKGGKEKVALYGTFLSIAGPGYKSGKEFYFSELDVGSPDRVTRLELRDVSGDGKAEIILAKRIGPDENQREILQVLQLRASDGAPVPVFAHEIAILTKDGRVENEVEFSGSGKATVLSIKQGKAVGFEPDTFREPSIGGGVLPALLPWQTVGEELYGWKGASLELLEQKPWEPKLKKKSPRVAAVGTGAVAPPPPRPPTSDELLDRVYALYRKDRGVGASKPRFDLVTDVVEDGQMERVLVHDRDLVVFGKGFKKGLSYTFLTIGVKDTKDILSVTTRDLVGDGKAEIIVVGTLPAQASKELGGDVVTRQALFVYKVVGETLTRVFAAETGRFLGKNRILGSIAFVPAARGVELELRPLMAVGWSARSYPFPEDRTAAGGLEPLLLPWGSVGPRRYRFDGQSFRAE